ncbi:MAG: hypothetical protein RLZZ502_949 [Pseudomonadota bacterium]|jgi:acyl-CoA thioesterase YciA
MSEITLVDLPVGKEPATRVIPMPADANHMGDIFGGWIMAQVDLAASVPARRAAKSRVATVAVNSFVFKQPVFIGDILSFYAEVTRIGRTSVTVNVEVFAQREVTHAKAIKVTEATLTFVALDEHKKPRVIV